MGFSNNEGGGGNLGDKLGGYIASHLPIANALGGMALGRDNNHQASTIPESQPGAPSMALPDVTQPDFSALLAQNSQPKKTGLSDFFKSMMGAG